MKVNSVMSPADNQEHPQQQQQSQHDLCEQYRSIGIKAVNSAAMMTKATKPKSKAMTADQFADRDDG
ncbi:hypothetical protein HDIA_1217 [Hartmannibacter diazotrophicus]|uniref:Uncharacterized protein n=2 Tax=Hartmannibacter diazotrophicus TaxID=1482074 RepID=A0A2C9D3M2_9HYPH|nr:hypothetical protein HDIA_1217 [Hartmannibacter diazotrophicus]